WAASSSASSALTSVAWTRSRPRQARSSGGSSRSGLVAGVVAIVGLRSDLPPEPSSAGSIASTTTPVYRCPCNDSWRGPADMPLEGLHHITAITGDAPGNVDFYARLLGLR